MSIVYQLPSCITLLAPQKSVAHNSALLFIQVPYTNYIAFFTQSYLKSQFLYAFYLYTKGYRHFCAGTPCGFYKLLCILAEGFEGQVGHVDVGLGNDLERSVHREDGHADVDGVDVLVGHILGNGAAAAQV